MRLLVGAIVQSLARVARFCEPANYPESFAGETGSGRIVPNRRRAPRLRRSKPTRHHRAPRRRRDLSLAAAKRRQDSISINLTVWDQFFNQSNTMSLGSYITPSGSLSLGDSLFITYTTPVIQQMYYLGDNLVVIWPGLVAPSSSDTSITTVHVLGNPASIQEHISKAKLLKVTDILGRETKGTKNEPLFYIYDDGTVEKRIAIE